MNQKKSLETVLMNELKFRSDIKPEEVDNVLQYLKQSKQNKENTQTSTNEGNLPC
jgi:hypothetical protein